MTESQTPGITAAMLDRMMERKLEMLEAEYQACVNATRAPEPTRNSDESKGKKSDSDDDDDEYTDYSSSYSRLDTHVNLSNPDHFTDSSDLPVEEKDAPPSIVQTRFIEPMTKEKAAIIKETMKAVKINYVPRWAKNIPESQWIENMVAAVESAKLSTPIPEQPKTKTKTKPKSNLPTVTKPVTDPSTAPTEATKSTSSVDPAPTSGALKAKNKKKETETQKENNNCKH